MRFSRYQMLRELYREQEAARVISLLCTISDPVIPPEPLPAPSIRNARALREDSPILSFDWTDPESALEALNRSPISETLRRTWDALPPFPNGGNHPATPHPPDDDLDDDAAFGGPDDALAEGSPPPAPQSTDHPAPLTAHTPDPAQPHDTAAASAELTAADDVDDDNDELPLASDVPDNNNDDDDNSLVLNTVEAQTTGIPLRIWRPNDPLPDFRHLWHDDIERLSLELRIFPDGRVMLNFATNSPFWGFRQQLARYIYIVSREPGLFESAA
ncbi:hypothetical protein PRK78_005471 [Emydomyces testavorans]|uniref:Uncharacterized protein n=1 Tax=Emydomyces testavorans TaxID=2070801 RepID=A0AAF0DKL6_9EURO|nr:hypothetical protein PRK78_005471 [Emydomyces testavorans]